MTDIYYFDECCHGLQDAEWHLTKEVKDIYPDFVKMAESFSVPAKRVLRPEELRPAIRYLSCKHAAYVDMSPLRCITEAWALHGPFAALSLYRLCCDCVI